MSAIGTDPPLTIMENEILQKKLERALAKNIELEFALHKVRKSTDTALQELSGTKMLEEQIGQALTSLRKKRVGLEETLTIISHSFDKLVSRTN